MRFRLTKRTTRLIALLCAALLLLSAGASAESAAAGTVFTREMIERSLLATGNTERLHRVIDKARSGETVTIAYLGGSITEGALASPQATGCYASLSAHHFADTYMPDPAKLNYINAGISGTPSLLGITRLEADVLQHQPDLVFVEFAVNDSGDPLSQGVYESLLRKLLSSETEPAVILIFTVLSGGHSGQEYMAKLGAHYQLGMISVKDAIWPEIEAGRMAWSDYSAEYVHPNKLENIRHGDPRIVTAGSFPVGAVSCYSYHMGWWHKGRIDGVEPMVLQLEGVTMTVAYKQMKDTGWGTAEVWVDGVCKLRLPGYDDGAWGNIQTQAVSLGSRGMHTVEIRMAEGDESKQFQLLDLTVVPEERMECNGEDPLGDEPYARR